MDIPVTENTKKQIGLIRLGIQSSVVDGKLIVHGEDKLPDDKTIMDAYAEYEAEQEALANAPSMEEKFERLQTKLVEKAVITEADKEEIKAIKTSTLKKTK